MDYIPPSMFQLFDETSTDELLQMFSTFPCKLDPKQEIQEDHQVPQPTPSQDSHHPLPHKRRRSSSIAFCENHDDDHHHDENPNDKKKKKIIHRDIERQRRQEMSALYASLRKLIPLQYLKGKRSISDQIHGSVNYIREQQRKIQELSSKRDNLKKLSNSISSPSFCTSNNIESQNSQRHNNNSESTNISMRHCEAGSVEVLVNTALREGLPLARVLGVLTRQGLSVVSCVSVKVNDRFLHTIESEAVSGEISMNLSELEHKLKNLI